MCPSAVVDKVGREVDIPNLHVLLVDELFEVVADELARFGVRHSGFGVDGFHEELRQAFAACGRNSAANSARNLSMVIEGRPSNRCNTPSTVPPFPPV